MMTVVKTTEKSGRLHVCEEDLETTQGEGVDFLAEILELVGWSQVNDEETETDLS
jgi:hypothetical protein